MIATGLIPRRQVTDLVTYHLIINGDEVPGTIPIRSIEVIHEVNRIPTATIRIADGDVATGEWTASSGEQFALGNEIEILVGYHSEDELIFKGIVTKQCIQVRDNMLELEIECKHQAVQLTGSRNSRQFLDISDSDLISVLLDEYDLAGTIEQ
ncbi:MAG: Rhs element Vgr protein, partial [Bacteroidota bacterium]